MRATVLITAKNEAPRIGRALQSIVDQGVPDVEILVVDDDSSDDTIAVASSYDGVRVVSSPGGGHVGALNHGLHEASADLVVKCDADDWHVAGSILALLAPLESDPTVDVVAGGSLCVTDDGHALERVVPMPTDVEMTYVSMTMCPIEHTACAYRRSAVLGIGGYRAERGVHATQDNDLWLRMLDAGHRFVGIDRVVAVHTITRRSVSARTATEGHDRARRSRAAFRAVWAPRLCTFAAIRRHCRDVVSWRARPVTPMPPELTGSSGIDLGDLPSDDTVRSDTLSYILARLVHLSLTDREYRRAVVAAAAVLSLGPPAIVRGAWRIGARRAANRRARGWLNGADLRRFALAR